MKISITARHTEISTGVRTFTEQRLEKIAKFSTDLHSVHVVFSQEKDRCLAEITARVDGTELVSTQSNAEAGAAVERALDRLEEQLRRHKDKRLTKTQRAGRPEIAADGTPDDDEQSED